MLAFLLTKGASLSTCSPGEKISHLCHNTYTVISRSLQVMWLYRYRTIWWWEWLYEGHSSTEKRSRKPIAQRNWEQSAPEASRPFPLVLQLKTATALLLCPTGLPSPEKTISLPEDFSGAIPKCHQGAAVQYAFPLYLALGSYLACWTLEGLSLRQGHLPYSDECNRSL